MQHLPRVTIWVSGYCSAQWPVSTFHLIAMTGAIRWSPAITFGEAIAHPLQKAACLGGPALSLLQARKACGCSQLP